MSDGTYRDDQEAAIERADALQHENEELREKIARLEHPPAKKSKVSRDYSPLAGMLVAFAVLVAMATTWLYESHKSRKKSARDAQRKLWIALTDAGGVMRNGLMTFAWEKLDEVAVDPRITGSKVAYFSESALTDGDLRELDTLLADDAYAPIADGIRALERAAVDFAAPRKAIDDYYLHRDWKDDDYARAPKLWKDLRAAAARTRVAADAIRDRFIATNHAELRRFQQQWERANGKDDAWWFAECGILLQLAADDYRMGDASKYEPDMDAFDAAVKQAPLNVRRATRDRTHKLEKPFHNELFKAMPVLVP